MRILVVGSGGREHALVWKLSQSPEITKLFCAPGNGGIGELAELVKRMGLKTPAESAQMIREDRDDPRR